MQAPRLTPAAYRRITLIAALAVGFIIVTGGAVRLTGSGLGCPDWPTCENDRVVAPLEYHAMVEFVNRSITGIVSVAVIVAVLGALVRQPRRRDLTWLSLGLVGGVVAQIVLGGLTVLFELRPQFVMAHFLVSMVILADAVVLHYRAALPDDRPVRPVVPADLRRMGSLVVFAAGAAIFLGTVVTGSGPHGGDPEVERLPFLVPDVARAHGASVILFLFVTLVTLWRLRQAGAPASLLRAGEALLAVSVAQAAIGYAQYLTGVPVLLVGIHIAGAAMVFAAAVRFRLGFSTAEAPTLPTAGPSLSEVRRA
ncbi:MAG: COX15/CtaA family protein [Actinomycetota bacterium]|nr:COX15/CtaA family protein [Actinomycetota bacterium]